MSDLDDVELYWEHDQVDEDAVLRLGIDTPFSPTAFDDLEIRISAENPFLLDEKEDKEKSLPTTPVPEKPTRLAALLKVCPFGTRKKIVPHYVYTNFFSTSATVYVF